MLHENLTVREGHKIAHRVEGHVRALLLENISRTHLLLYALHSDDEETDRVKVRAHVKSVGRKDDPLEQIVTRLSLEPGVTTIRWEIVSELDGGEGIVGTGDR